MEKNFKLFCYGFGQVAKYFVRNLIDSNFKFDLVTTNTTRTEIRYFKDLKHKSYYFFDNNFDQNLIEDLNSSNKILISIPPQNKIDTVLKMFDKNFQKNKFDWVTYLSATSVYGDKQGQWVDETTIPRPTSTKGIARLNAEKNWLKLFNNFGLPVQIFRLSGIYSFEKNIINRIKEGKLKIVEKNNQFFSRIHIEDIAAILKISFQKFNPGQIFNISDDYPCSNIEIAEYASNLTKINLPKKIKFNDIKNQTLKDFFRDSKKISNKKMKNFFQYNLKYPTFKEGLRRISGHII